MEQHYFPMETGNPIRRGMNKRFRQSIQSAFAVLNPIFAAASVASIAASS